MLIFFLEILKPIDLANYKYDFLLNNFFLVSIHVCYSNKKFQKLPITELKFALNFLHYTKYHKMLQKLAHPKYTKKKIVD